MTEFEKVLRVPLNPGSLGESKQKWIMRWYNSKNIVDFVEIHPERERVRNREGWARTLGLLQVCRARSSDWGGGVERHVCAKGTNLYIISIKNKMVTTTLILWVDHPIGGVKTESPVITYVHTLSRFADLICIHTLRPFDGSKYLLLELSLLLNI